MPLKRPSEKACRTIKIGIVILYLVCCALEFGSYWYLFANVGVVCIKFYEISAPVKNALMWANVAIVPDLVAAILGLPLKKLYHHSLGIAYNSAVGFCITVRSITLLTGLTFCGQPLQLHVLKVAIVLLVAGIVHLIIAVLNLLICDKDESFRWRKLTNQMYTDYKAKLTGK